MNPKTFIKESRFIVSIQAQRILSQTKFTAADVVEWKISKGMGIGGNDVAFFLEDMSKAEEANK